MSKVAASDTFLLDCFVSLKDSPLETGKCLFFTSKALFVVQIIIFQLFKYSNAQA